LNNYDIINIDGGTMKNVYLLNNMSTDNEIKKEFDSLNLVDTIVLIAGDFNNYDANRKAEERVIKWLESMKITYNYVHMIDNRQNKGNQERLINSSDLVIMMDGHPIKQIKHIEKNGINHLLANKQNLIAFGYGATNLGYEINLAKNEKRNIVENYSYQGIGVTDLNIEPHFDEMDLFHNPSELMPNTIFNETTILTKDSGIVIGDQIKYINNIYHANYGKLEKVSINKRK
jgi:hypothetical protein